MTWPTKHAAIVRKPKLYMDKPNPSCAKMMCQRAWVGRGLKSFIIVWRDKQSIQTGWALKHFKSSLNVFTLTFSDVPIQRFRLFGPLSFYM